MKNNIDLSVLIPARNEIYLKRTIEDILANIRGNTEILVCLDGAWANPPLEDDPRLTVLYHNESVGQRAGTNDLARLARGKYLMKIDAHCKVSEGFDVELIKGFEKLGDNIVQLPVLYNLHAFNWKCKKCGNEWYQAPTPKMCYEPGESRKKNEACDNTTDFEKVMIWDRRISRKSEAYCFDADPHFQYDREQMKRSQGDFVESMSIQGSCFVVSREHYFKWNVCDESFGSWGSQGIEVACKAWLSGGKVVTNRHCWYAHLFRTQGGDFGFPFPIGGKQIDHAKQTARDLFYNNAWDQQVRPLQWLIEKFNYPRDWTPEKVEQLIKPWDKKTSGSKWTKGIIYYTDNQLNLKVARAVQERLKSMGLHITSASLKPMEFGNNIYVPRERGVLTMFIQILTALQNATEDIVYFCEHDVLYHPSHFEFTPSDKDKFYYNENVWKLDQQTGKAVHYRSKQVSGIAVFRKTAIEHYTKRIDMVKKDGFSMKMGYEPGTHHRPERVDDLTSAGWMSPLPNVDVRHAGNLSPTRWKKEEFRNQKYTAGWTEGDADSIPGWRREDFGFLNKN